MALTCENCNQPLFDTDKICWHCGWKQSPLVKPEVEPQQSVTEPLSEKDQESEIEPVAPPLIFLYGGLTVVTIIALLLIMRTLGRSPIVILKSSAIVGDWVSLQDPRMRFAIDIPVHWDWQFQEGKQSQPEFADLLANDFRIPAAVSPLGKFVSDIDYLLLATNESSIIVIARSDRLNRLSPQQAVASLQQEQFDHISVSEARLIQNAVEEDVADFSIIHTDPPLYCRQYFVPGPLETYIVAACSSPEGYDLHQDEFNKTLLSFRILGH